MNSVLARYEELLRPRFALSVNTNFCLNNSSYPARPHSIIVYYNVNLSYLSNAIKKIIDKIHGHFNEPVFILYLESSRSQTLSRRLNFKLRLRHLTVYLFRILCMKMHFRYFRLCLRDSQNRFSSKIKVEYHKNIQCLYYATGICNRKSLKPTSERTYITANSVRTWLIISRL